MSFVRKEYSFTSALGGFFEMDIDVARSLLPKKLHPLELRPGCAVLGVMAIDFDQSEAGPYGEIVLSIAVPPDSQPPNPFPHSSFFVLWLGTTTEESREHAMEYWKFSCYPNDITTYFSEDKDKKNVIVKEGDLDILRLSVAKKTYFKEAKRYYQCFTEQKNLYQLRIDIEGEMEEHEEETGELFMADHPFCQKIDLALESLVPFREQSMGKGIEYISNLTRQ